MDEAGRPDSVVDYRRIQEDIFGGGKRWIVALDIAAATSGYVEGLQNRGAGPCLAIGASRGTGPLPPAESGPEPIILNVSADSMMEGIWASQQALANLPDWACELIDEFDPDGEARVIGTIFDDGAPVGGRTKFGRRLPEWRSLEDKTVVDALWQELGVAHAPFRVVDMEFDLLWEATKDLDDGDGVVWAGDARSGFHGGAEFTRWVRDEAAARRVFDRFRQFCDAARVMPFLEGTPCSIHGVVFPDYVVAGRPCEMLVLREDGRDTFRYATAATFWDPPTEHREAMRGLVRRVGAHLRETVGFRGAFTIDGVLTRDGFRPTELNPRFGGALGSLIKGMQLGLTYIDLALMEGLDVDWNPEKLELMILEHADNHRNGRSNLIVTVETEVGSQHGIRRRSGALQLCDPDVSGTIATVTRGPATAGTYLGITYHPEQIPVGPSMAPLAAELLNFLNEEWGLGLPHLTAAPDLFRELD